MTMLAGDIRGSGLGGGSSSGSGKGGGGKGGGGDAENTLRSKARARMVEVISEGVIEGLVNGSKSIFFDTTPVQNADESYNFKNVVVQEHRGLPDDTHFTGINGVETPTQVEVQVKNALGPVQRTIVDTNADAVRVIIRLPSLFHQDKENGGMKTASVHYQIHVRAYQGAWQLAVDNNIQNQKCVSPYQIAHRVELPFEGSPWDIKVTRISADSDVVEMQNDLWWEGYVVIVDGKFTYPNTAAVALEVNAEDMGSSIPARAFHVKGLKIQVPTNYDPVTRSYSGIWDGTFKTAYSNNPAWIFYDLITNDRYGLGEFIRPEIVDKWSLYTIGQYCDQPVKSGYKNGDTGADIYEPRFTFNGVINSRDDAYFVLQQVTTAWRGMAFWSLGQVFATADYPADPVKVIAPANVVNGEFNYSGTAMKARHSVCLVKWNDPNDFYRPSVEVVINEDMLKRYGWREKQLQLNGCTSRGLAHRYGKWVLDVEQHETETVEYTVSWDNADTRPGQIVAVADPAKAQVRLGGRIKSYDADEKIVTLDYPFEPTDGETYWIMVVLPDGSLAKKLVIEFVANDQVRVADAFAESPAVDAMFAMTGTDIQPRQYRIIAVEETEDHLFKVTALFHDPNKYARVEDGIAFDPVPYSRPKNVAYPPTNLSAKEVAYTLNGVTYSRILLSWTPNPNMLARSYRVFAETPFDGVISMGDTDRPWVELQNVVAGTYRFRVYAVSVTGLLSDAAELEIEATGPEGIPLPTVSDIELADRPTEDTFVGRDVRIVWRNNFATSSDPAADGNTPTPGLSPLYHSNIVKVYDNATNTLLRTQTVTSASYTYSYDMNRGDCATKGLAGPTRTLRFEITCIDRFGRSSLAVGRVFTNPVPAEVMPSYFVNGRTVFFSFPPASDADFTGYMIWSSEEEDFDPGEVTPVVSASSSYTFQGDEDTDYYFRFAAFDAFGTEGIVLSTELHVRTLPGIDVEAPVEPTGLVLSTRTESIAGVVQRLILIATLDVPGEEDFAYFDFAIKQNEGNYVSFSSSSNSFEWSVLPDQAYAVKARAVDALGNASTYCDPEALTTPTIPELAHLINAGSVSIDAGKVTISGGTQLSDWRRGGDETKIDGGAISANTIQGNSLVIGNRNVTIEDIEFEHNKGGVANRLGWTAGTLRYVGDDGNYATRNIDAGQFDWSADTLYVYWVKGATDLSATTDIVTAFSADHLVMAAYRGGASLIANYGRTIIDGSKIKTGTIQADQLAVNSINATHIQSNTIDATHIKVNAVDADKIAANAVTADKISVATLSAISANIGDVTSGLVRSTNDKMRVELDNARILIAD